MPNTEFGYISSDTEAKAKSCIFEIRDKDDKILISRRIGFPFEIDKWMVDRALAMAFIKLADEINKQ